VAACLHAWKAVQAESGRHLNKRCRLRLADAGEGEGVGHRWRSPQPTILPVGTERVRLPQAASRCGGDRLDESLPCDAAGCLRSRFRRK
jgi:hypothetical protein